MNWTDVAVGVILGGVMYYGWKKGFLVAFLELIKWIAAIVLARVFYVPFTDWMIRTFGNPIDKISVHVKTYLYDMLGFNEQVAEKLPFSSMETSIEVLKFPKGFEEKLRLSIIDKAVDTTHGFVEEATHQMSDMILYGLGFLVLILIILIAIGIFQSVGQIITKLPLIKTLNNSGGLILGALIGLTTVYFIMAVLQYLRAFEWSRETLTAIEASKYAIYFYKYNILQYFFGVLLIYK